MILSFSESAPATEVGFSVADRLQQGSDFVHVQGTALHNMETADQMAYIREASQSIGQLTLTGNIAGSELWELDASTSPNANFIPFHTDNPFYENPEEIVGFWNIRSSTAGGENIMLPVHNLVDWMHKRPEHSDLYEELVEQEIAFTHKDTSAKGPILKPFEGTVRYDQKYIAPEHAALGERLTTALQGTGAIQQRVKLQPGDALFFNNLTTLHARAPYDDTSRLSVRVRIAEL